MTTSEDADSPAGLWRLLASPRLLLLCTLVLAAVSLLGLKKLRNEDDVLVFLPEGEPEVVVFKDVARRFGAMRVALIGVAPRDQNVFSHDLLSRIGRLSATLKNTAGVDRVVSLSTMTDLQIGDGGVDVRALLPDPLPTDPAALQKLRQHSMELSTVRGNVLSGDGRSTMVMVFFGEGAKTNTLAETARALAQSELGPVADLYFGGAPFAGPAIYADTQRDVRRLTPIAMALFFAIVLLAFRGILPVVLTVSTVALSGVIVLGLMGFAGEAFTVVTGTLPLILFASGSQYAIHILGRYYLIRGQTGVGKGADSHRARLLAVREAIRVAGPPVTLAAVNCALGFLSFSVMNISAMRSFGYACGVGVGLCLLLAVSLLPAVIARWEGGTTAGEHVPFTGLGALIWRSFELARRHRVAVIGVSALAALLCGGGLMRVQVRMEPRAFFRPGSEPALAQRFLDESFGGAQFAQILIERTDGGPMTDPRGLAEIRRLLAYARSLRGVTQVQSFIEPLSLVSSGMAAIYGLPQRQSQVEQLLFFLEGEASLRMLFSPDRKAVLLHVRVLGDAAPVMVKLADYVRGRFPFALRRATPADLTDELTFTLPPSVAVDDALRARVLATVQKIGAAGVNLVPAPVPKPPAAAGATEPEVTEGKSPEDLRMEVAQGRASQLLVDALVAGQGPAVRDAVTARRNDINLVAAELISPPLDETPGLAISAKLTGEPMLDRAFSRAVERNQWLSLGVALSAVLIALLIAQRALWPAILCVLPAMMSLLVVFGTLGLVGQPIDLGTSLVGSIVTSSGADFAMHYVWYLVRRRPSEVVPTVGPVIATTAALLGLGMGVLMLGAAPPLRLFGGLACAGLLLSALFTFFLVPALLSIPAESNLQESSR